MQSKNHLFLNSGEEGEVESLNVMVSTASCVFSVFHVEALLSPQHRLRLLAILMAREDSIGKKGSELDFEGMVIFFAWQRE